MNITKEELIRFLEDHDVDFIRILSEDKMKLYGHKEDIVCVMIDIKGIEEKKEGVEEKKVGAWETTQISPYFEWDTSSQIPLLYESYDSRI